MPKLTEAAVAVAGMIVGVEEVTEFGTDKSDGVRVLIATGDGYASVKLNVDRTRELKPDFGQQVAWLIRFGAYANKERQSDAQAYCTFVRELVDSDVQRIAQASQSGKQQKAA